MKKSFARITIITDNKLCTSKSFKGFSTEIIMRPEIFTSPEIFKLEIEKLADDLPVIFLSKLYRYPLSYLSFLLDFWLLHKKTSFGYLPLVFEQKEKKVRVKKHPLLKDVNLCSLLHIHFSCFNSSDIKKIASSSAQLKFLMSGWASIGLHPTLPSMHHARWSQFFEAHSLPISDPETLICLSQSSPKSFVEFKNVANSSNALVKNIFTEEIEKPIHTQTEELEFFVQESRFRSDFSTCFNFSGAASIIQSGGSDLLSRACSVFFQRAFRLGTKDEDFLQALNIVQINNFASQIWSSTLNLPKHCLLVNNVKLLTPWLKLSALVCDQRDFDHELRPYIEFALSTRNKRALFRLNGIILDFSTPEVHLNFIELINKSTNFDLLLDGDFLRPIADKYLVGESLTVDYKGLLEEESLASIQSITKKLIGACISNNKETFLNALVELFWGNKKIDAVLTSLFPYSNELADLNIKISDLNLPSCSNQRQIFILAVILKDTGYIQKAPKDPDDHIASVAFSQANDFSVFTNFLRKLPVNPHLVQPCLSGKSVNEVFKSLHAAVPPSKEDYGKVSVIMTVFNPDIDLLRLSLDSIVNQSYQNLEIIFVDDDSTYKDRGKLAPLVARYQNAKFIQSKENSGPYVSRNIALEHATGKFIAIQDADDFSHPQRLEIQLEALSKKHQSALSVSQHVRIDKFGTIQFEAGFKALGDGTMTSVYNKDVFEKVGLFLKVRSRGDVEMRQRIINKCGAFSYIQLDYPLVYCFADANTLSQSVARNRQGALSLFREQINLSYDAEQEFGTGSLPSVPLALRP